MVKAVNYYAFFFLSYFSFRGIREGDGGFVGKSGVEKCDGITKQRIEKGIALFFCFPFLSFIHSSIGHSFVMFVIVMSFLG